MSTSFQSLTTYAAGPSPVSVTTADLNGDGKLDLIVADYDGGVAVLLGDGSGGFGAATTYAAGPNPHSITTADLNGDGKLDLVVADAGGGVAVLLGDGSGGFGAATTYAAGSNPATVTTADVNRDGKLDLVVADAGGGVAVLLGNGSGGFDTATTYAAGQTPYSVTTADVNGDGKLDLVVGDYQGGVAVLLGNGSGGFGTAATYAAGPTPQSVTTADVNRDGKLDLVVADAGGGVAVLLGDGSGGFDTATTYAAGLTPVSVTTADVNGDGKLDLVVADLNGGIEVLLGDGSGGFGAAITYAAGQSPYWVTTADVNGDGKLDLAVADLNGGVAVLLNNSQAPGTFDATSVGTALGSDTGLVIDTTPPTVTITSTGGLTNTISQAITGTGEAGTSVTVLDGKTVIGTTTVGQNGIWSAIVPLSGDGPHGLAATDTDAAGNAATTPAVLYTLDTTPPAVTVTSTGGLTNKATQTVTGTGEAGTSVNVLDGKTVIGTTTVGQNGIWSAIVPLGGDGPHSLTATDTDAAGNATTTPAVLYTLDTTPPAVTFTSTGGLPGTVLVAGFSFAFRLTTSEPVTVSGTPALTLNDGATAQYIGIGGDQKTLSFVYKVGATDNTSDLKVTGLSGGTISDLAGNTLNSTNATFDTGLIIDTIAPSGFTFAPDGAHLSNLEGSASALATNTSLGTLTEKGGTPGDKYTFSITGSTAFTVSSNASIGMLSTSAAGVTGKANGSVYALNVQVTDTTNGLKSALLPFDVVVGSSGADTVKLTGSHSLGLTASTPAFIYGLGANDTIDATGMTASLWLAGGSGADKFTGGSGADTYIYGATAESTASNLDVITNFSSTLDKIDLTGIGGGALAVLTQQLSGSSLAAHTIAWQQKGANTFVYVNTTSGTEQTGNANMAIQLSGNLSLTSGNILHN